MLDFRRRWKMLRVNPKLFSEKWNESKFDINHSRREKLNSWVFGKCFWVGESKKLFGENLMWVCGVSQEHWMISA